MSDSTSPSGGGPATMSRTTIAISAGVTAVLAFAIGFGFAVSGDDRPDEVAIEVPPTSAPTTTSTTTVPDGAPETTGAPTTVVPEITAPTTPPEVTVPTTTPPTVVVTQPPTTASPAQLTVQYPRDSADRLVMNRGGTATLTITNSGGSLAQWLVQASGYVFVDGVANGTLQPGQSVQVRLRGAPEVPPISPQGSVTVSGGSGNQISISVLVL